MASLHLSVATTDYDHFRDFRLGLLTAEGLEVTWLNLGHHECFARFTSNREFDVAELSFAKFMTQVSREESDIIGLPVVCSRLFSFSSFYVNRKSGISKVEDLKGRKVGSPEWAHSAAVYMRGWMHNEKGVTLTDVQWYQAGANAPGREEKVELKLPTGVAITRVPDKSLSEMLGPTRLTARSSRARQPAFSEGHPDVVRLFPDYLDMEEEYYTRTKVRPIMHIIAMRRDIVDEYPGSHAISTTRSSRRSGDPSSASSIPRCHAIPYRGWPPTRAGCRTCSAATCFRTGSRRTGRRGSRWRSIRISRGSRTG
jgi:4,5-dihydroxyphthalate decarboxylase